MNAAAFQPLRWDHPGADPYTGGKAAAVMRLGTIPEDTRRTLAMMVDGRFGGVHTTWTSGGESSGRFGHLRAMNFGNGRIHPGPIDTSGWTPGHTEGAMVFCADGHCVAWFARCGNIAIVDDLHGPAPALSARDAHAARIGLGGIEQPMRPDGTIVTIPAPVGRSAGAAMAVPEPAGLLLALPALALAAIINRRRRIGGAAC
jgi:hypothetical protein